MTDKKLVIKRITDGYTRAHGKRTTKVKLQILDIKGTPPYVRKVKIG